MCRKAHLYLQIGYGQATGSALPRRNSICGKQRVAEYTWKFRHLNRKETQKNHRNTLRNFLLRGFNRHLSWFRCGGKGKHLNLASRQNQSVNPLTTNALQDSQQLPPRFRFQPGLERSGMQMCPGGASGGGIPERANRIAHASEPEKIQEIHRNTLKNFILRGFNKNLPWFRCQQGSECHRLQMCPGGTSEKGIPERTNRTA